MTTTDLTPDTDPRVRLVADALWYLGTPVDEVGEHETLETVRLALAGKPVSLEALDEARSHVARLFRGVGKPQTDEDREMDRHIGEVWQALTLAHTTERFIVAGLDRDEAASAAFLYVKGEWA